MFSLIIAIVSIALIVATVAATMYHGGDTLTQGRAQADAAGLVAGGQQIVAAYHMQRAITGADVASVNDLLVGKSLSSMPKNFSNNVFLNVAGANGLPNHIADWNSSVSLATCQALDKLAGATPAASQDEYPNGQQAADFARPFGCVADEAMHFYFKI